MWLNLLVGGSPLLTIMATSQNWENIRPNTTIEKTRFYSLWGATKCCSGLYCILQGQKLKVLIIINCLIFIVFLLESRHGNAT